MIFNVLNTRLLSNNGFGHTCSWDPRPRGAGPPGRGVRTVILSGKDFALEIQIFKKFLGLRPKPKMIRARPPGYRYDSNVPIFCQVSSIPCPSALRPHHLFALHLEDNVMRLFALERKIRNQNGVNATSVGTSGARRRRN